MASVLTVLLGCWLAGQSRVSGQGSYPKPSISVSPRGVIPMGGKVTIRCRHQDWGMRFLLYKDGAGNYLNYTDPAGSEAEFPITSARREHGGSYTCRYIYRSGGTVYSELSDPVQIIVAELSYPKPSISLSPSWGVSLGAAVTVRCQGQRRGMRFVLNKEHRHFPPLDSDGFEAEFPISIMSWEDSGSYSCFYHSRSEPFTMSYPSNPVELVVRDRSLSKPSISLSPTGVTAPGADVTIRCQGQRQDVRFFLHKAGDLNPQRHMDPAGAGAEFRIPSVGRQHGGSYSCSYRPRSQPFISSYASSSVELVVADEGPGSTALLPATPSEGGLELPARPGLTNPMIAGASAAAAGLLLLLLLVAFVCFRKTRARKRDAPRPSSTSPLVVLKAPAQQDPVYASVDEGKELQTLPQEPDPDGLTYAELNHQALQAKQGGLAPDPDPVQPSVYAAINMSQGGPLQ
ncbi:leukocyte immunoglobulin-like receptor subfamily B member 2 [Mauremys reevesii]|uniref:leukocyte immunoglobulin-like receptor subfamily B member 2 n=1 Tax=Mauremys reevesii TaxID=260615 RepID=UPI00193EC718|nr:leukocyte immunoglobulin-like receptor subfamily B member 2 [Mauremys reevesii]